MKLRIVVLSLGVSLCSCESTPRESGGVRETPNKRKATEKKAKTRSEQNSAATSPQSGRQNQAPEQPIIDILQEQVDAWNRGDLEGFMDYYWRSEDLIFDADGTMHKGWQATMERYQRRYPDKETMGQLAFRDLDVRVVGDSARVSGNWQVESTDKTREGSFVLRLRKIHDRWLIVHDHTETR